MEKKKTTPKASKKSTKKRFGKISKNNGTVMQEYWYDDNPRKKYSKKI